MRIGPGGLIWRRRITIMMMMMMMIMNRSVSSTCFLSLSSNRFLFTSFSFSSTLSLVSGYYTASSSSSSSPRSCCRRLRPLHLFPSKSSQQYVTISLRTKNKSRFLPASSSSSIPSDAVVHDDDDDEEEEEAEDESSLYDSTYHAPVMWQECVQALMSGVRARARAEAQGADAPRLTNAARVQPKERVSRPGAPPFDHHSLDRAPLIWVDGTCGGGGHAAALGDVLGPGDVVVGVDVDPTALATATARWMNTTTSPSVPPPEQEATATPLHDSPPTLSRSRPNGPFFVTVQANFADLTLHRQWLLDRLAPQLEQLVSSSCWNDTEKMQWWEAIQAALGPDGVGVDGILLDLGVSSHQIDTAERGFSFMRDGPLDMRMAGGGSSSSSTQSPSTLTAADLCNELDVHSLQQLLQQYGDEPRAKTVAQALVDRRPLYTTQDLRQAIAAVTPAFVKKGRRLGRTATLARVFQSLRIAVNQEEQALEKALTVMAPALIRPGGRLVILTYHSLEDRLVKQYMRDGVIAGSSRRRDYYHPEEKDLYGNRIGAPRPFRTVGKALKASDAEVQRNSRARSATLRVAERQ